LSNDNTGSNGIASIKIGMSSMDKPVASASGSRVWRQRTNGLDTNRETGTSIR
jgi:hypothetical protein